VFLTMALCSFGLSLLLGLSQFVGCGPPQVLYSEEVSDQHPAVGEIVSALPRVCLRIGQGFSPSEQDKILTAVASENLTATAQFDFAPETTDTPQPRSWTLLRKPGEPAHVTLQFAQGGGAIALDANRLNAGDLHKAIAEAGSLTVGTDLQCRSAGTPTPAEPPHPQTSHGTSD
jgi:hypothetical protein